MVRSQDKPNYYPFYSVQSNMDSFILHHDICLEEAIQDMDNKSDKERDVKLKGKIEMENDEDGLWNMDFDGAVIKEGAWASIWISNTKTGKSQKHSYKLAF